ncbi:MAG: M15 family metallopeptidase [Bacteroidota bacterium]
MAKDKITLERMKLMHPDVREEMNTIYSLIDVALTGKAICRFAYTLRTYKEQNDLFALGRTVVNPNGKSTKHPKGSIVTNAKGGQSYHNFGLAFDIVLLKDTKGNGKFDAASWETNVDFDGDGKPDWREIVTIAKQHGWEWGGDWKFTDMPHFQKTFGRSVVDLAKMVQDGKVFAGTTYPILKL